MKKFIKKFTRLKFNIKNKFYLKKRELRKKWILKSVYFNKVNSLHNQNKKYNLKKNKYFYNSKKVMNKNFITPITKDILSDLQIISLFNRSIIKNISKNKLKSYFKNSPNLIYNKFINLYNFKKPQSYFNNIKKIKIKLKKQYKKLKKTKNKLHTYNLVFIHKPAIKKITSKLGVYPFKLKFILNTKNTKFNNFIRRSSQLKWFKKHFILNYKGYKYKYSKRWTKKNIYRNKVYSKDQRRLFRYKWYYNPNIVGIKKFNLVFYRSKQLKIKKQYNKSLFLSKNYKHKLIYLRSTKKLLKNIRNKIKLKHYKTCIQKNLNNKSHKFQFIKNLVNIRRGFASRIKKFKQIGYINKFKTKQYRFVKRHKWRLFTRLNRKKITKFYLLKKKQKFYINYNQPLFKIKILSKNKSKIIVYNYNKWQVSRKLRYKIKWKRRFKKIKRNAHYFYHKMMKYHKKNQFKKKIFIKIPKNLKQFWNTLVEPNEYFKQGILNSVSINIFKHIKHQFKNKDKLLFIKNNKINININNYGAIKIIINKSSTIPFIQTFDFNLIKFNSQNKIWINSSMDKKILIIYNTTYNKYYYINSLSIGFIQFNIINMEKQRNYKTFLIKNYNLLVNSVIINFKINNLSYTNNNKICFNNSVPVFYKNKNIKKHKKISSALIKLNKNIINKLSFFKKVWLTKTFFTNFKIQHNTYKNKNINNLIKNAINELHYEENFYGHYDEFSFKWKFFTKKWFFHIFRWKCALAFKWLMRKAWNNYRKLQKNFMFIKLFRTNFLLSTGLTEFELLNEWKRIRKGNSNNNMLLEQFNKQLQFKLDGIVMLFGLAPNRLISQELVKCGGVRINGIVITNPNKFLFLNNIIQFDKLIINNIRSLYSLVKWNFIKTRIKYIGFVQAIWGLLLFKFIRLPYKYEIFEESILTERWLRFFIRYFPIKISKFKKQKIKWYKY